jgi:hypothetical protein
MRLGIFGDSYADAGHGSRDFQIEYKTDSWPGILEASDSSHRVEFFAKSGTSHWYSYSKFIKNYHRYDKIIFVHTTPSRWPVLPDSESIGSAWNIGYCDGSETLNNLNKYFFDIFPDDLRSFISYSIFKNVNELCNDKNIHLTNIIPFEDACYLNHKTKFPIIRGIDKLSHIERIRYKGSDQDMYSFLSQSEIIDERFCHLNKHNNQKFAELLINIIRNNTLYTEINLPDLDIWQLYDSDLDKLYLDI